MWNNIEAMKEMSDNNKNLLNQLYAETEKDVKESVSLWTRVFGKGS